MVTGNFREQLKFMNAISTNQIAGLLKWGIQFLLLLHQQVGHLNIFCFFFHSRRLWIKKDLQ